MIIDSHAHIYPDKLAVKAARSIGDFYDIDMNLDGTVDMLLKVGDDAGLTNFSFTRSRQLRIRYAR